MTLTQIGQLLELQAGVDGPRWHILREYDLFARQHWLPVYAARSAIVQAC
jgi:hypothetical protein